MTNMIRISKAAKALGITRARLYQLIEEGSIPYIEIDGYKFIDLNNLGSWTPRKSEEKTNAQKLGGENT